MGLLLLVGCGKDTLAPLSGDLYVLESIAGQNLPALYEFEGGTSFRILSDTMALGASGRGERRSVYESYQGTKRAERIAFDYTLTGTQLAISVDCPDGAICVAPPHYTGTTTTTSLTITASKVARVPWVYRRLTPP